MTRYSCGFYARHFIQSYGRMSQKLTEYASSIISSLSMMDSDSLRRLAYLENLSSRADMSELGESLVWLQPRRPLQEQMLGTSLSK